MIHHPQNELLELYASGDLSSPLTSMMSAHIDVCQKCKSFYRMKLNNLHIQFESSSTNMAMHEHEIENAFDSVFTKMSNVHPQTHQAFSEEVTISVSGQNIKLPHSMSFINERHISWKEFGQNNAIAPVVVSPKGNLYLIYIGPGERVPEHNHTGNEYSYVVAGSYDDGHSTFQSGDFSFSNQQITHSPYATSDDGCLVLSWVEGRLNYFTGILRPLNSILWWYLHRA